MCQINSITRFCGANAAGIGTLYLADIDGVASIPAADTDTWQITTAITFTGDAGFISIPFAEFTGGLNIEMVGEVDGQTIVNKIPFKVGKIRPELNKWFNDALGSRCIALLVDNNGQTMLLGSLTSPLRLMGGKGGTGLKAGDFNGYEFELHNENGVPAYFYTSTVTLSTES